LRDLAVIAIPAPSAGSLRRLLPALIVSKACRSAAAPAPSFLNRSQNTCSLSGAGRGYSDYSQTPAIPILSAGSLRRLLPVLIVSKACRSAAAPVKRQFHGLKTGV